MHRSKLPYTGVATLALAAFAPAGLQAAGTLTPVDSSEQPVRFVEHQVAVVIDNGFARVEVEQSFFNPNDHDVEAHYAFPVPEGAALSELHFFSGEVELAGEVVERQRARQIYEQEKEQGRDAGLAERNAYQSFDFLVQPVKAQDTTRTRFVYYQPLHIDTGVGRFVYPLEEGGTDDAARSFWLRESKVQGKFSIDVELLSTWPIAELRAPGYDSATSVEPLGDGHYRLRFESSEHSLERDFVVYYRLADDQPGRVELLTHRADPNEPGTFMLVLTPGLDLAPLTGGVDYCFVLDVSGSMDGDKLATLAQGVEQTIGELQPEDRFRVVTFDDSAHDLLGGYRPATADEVASALERIGRLSADGGTNLYDGLALGLEGLDADRASTVILVTDAVTNTGVVDPREFHHLMSQVDVRVFGFLLGNAGNWPLLQTITDASGGYYKAISSSDDLLGQVLLAKSKVTHEALHDVDLRIDGVDAHDMTGDLVKKVYRGQQLVIFGRYEKSGTAKVELVARQSGRDETYETWFEFPEQDTSHPELERLWALARIDMLDWQAKAGLAETSEVEPVMLDLALRHQLVTDRTSMIVLQDTAFEELGIKRCNRHLSDREKQAQQARAGQGQTAWKSDGDQPAFHLPAASPSSGSGAIGGVELLVVALFGALALWRR